MRNFTKASLAIFFGTLIAGLSITKLNAQCNSAFTYVINAPSVNFTANDNTPGKEHVWNFGDGTTTWGSYWEAHTYGKPGQYNVTHFIYDSLTQCSDSTTQVIAVNFSPTCQAYFDYYTGEDSLIASTYLFNDNSSATGGSAAISSYAWTANGAAIGSYNSFWYTFPQSGTYNVCLNITTLAGCTSQMCKDVTVYGHCNLGPSFTYTVNTGYPATVNFVPHPDVADIEYKWRINTYFITEKTPSVQFYQSGSYSATLFMVDTVNKCYDSASNAVNVPVFPCDTINVSFNWQPSSADSSVINFTGIGNDSLTSQHWTMQSIYDSSVNVNLYTNNPSYKFADTGYYQVCLNANTLHCGARSYCNTIYIPGKHGGVANPIVSYPNPATNSVGIDVPLPTAGSININIYNEGGTRVLALQTQGLQGTNHITIPVQQLNRGQYFINVITGSGKHNSIFQKL